MMNLTKPLILIFTVFFLFVNCGGESGPTITDNEVIVKTGSLDVHFLRVKPFAETYLIFGGGELKQSEAVTKVSLAGLEINTARSIHSRYPDFYACKSPGAPLAQRAICQLDIVPADSKVLDALRKTLADHEASIHQKGKRTCVCLTGEVLKVKSAIFRQNEQDVTNDFFPEKHHDYYLVKSVEMVDAQQALAGG
jgi:hypothetical protein